MAKSPQKNARKSAIQQEITKEEWSSSYFTVLGLIITYLAIEAFMRSGATNNKDTIGNFVRTFIQNAVDKIINLNILHDDNVCLNSIVILGFIAFIFFITTFAFGFLLKKYARNLKRSFLLQMTLSVLRLLLVFVFIILIANWLF